MRTLIVVFVACLVAGLEAAPERPGAPLSCPRSQGLFSHPTDCHKFLHCDHGHPYVKDCPANLHFNARFMVCDWPENAGCVGGTPTDPPTPDVPPEPGMECDCECCLKPDGDDCTAYYICKDGKAYLAQCPTGLVFNPNIDNCDLPSNYQCAPTTTPKTPTSGPGFDCPTSNGLFPNPKDCHSFYHCSNGHAYLKDCPANLEFNPVLLVCDWPEHAGCGGNPTPRPPTTTPHPQPTPNPDIICPDDTCVCRVPDPTDCHKYYQCKDGKAYPAECPTGLAFNPKTEMCDYPANVPGCAPTPKPTTKPTTRPTRPTKPTKPTRPTKPTKKPDSSSSSSESGSGSHSHSGSGSHHHHSGSGSHHHHSGSGSHHHPSGSGSHHHHSGSGSHHHHPGSDSKHHGSDSRHHGSGSKHHGSKSKHHHDSAEHMKASAPEPRHSALYRNPDQGAIEDDDGFLEAQFCPRPNGKFPSTKCHYYYHCIDGVPTKKRCLHGTRFYARGSRCILGSC